MYLYDHANVTLRLNMKVNMYTVSPWTHYTISYNTTQNCKSNKGSYDGAKPGITVHNVLAGYMYVHSPQTWPVLR
jgi:hypothetical protein